MRLLVFVLGALLALPVWAQIISKPVRVIVPFPAGGGTDVLARIVAEKLRGTYAPSVIVENRVGASGRVGPVAIVARSQLALAAGSAVPASVRTARDYVEWVKSNPKSSFFATTSAGGAPALQDLLGGQIPVSINPVGELLPFVKTGKIRVLATTGAERSSFLPDVPTMSEAGYRDVVVQAWLGFLAPARTPQDTIAKLSNAVADAARSPDVSQNMEKFGMQPAVSGPAAFAVTIKADIERWGPVVKASGFTAED